MKNDARRQPRSSLFITAVLQTHGKQAAAKVRNMSPNGAMVDAELALPVGSRIELVRGRLSATGVVVWTSRNRFGLQFSSELAVKDWLAAPEKAEQQRVDEIISLIKAGALPEQKSCDILSDITSRSPDGQIADDLGTVVCLIQQLEDDLAASDETLARHGEKLQNLDIAMQMLRSIARQFMSGADDQPSNAASLGSLRVVCARALGKPRD